LQFNLSIAAVSLFWHMYAVIYTIRTGTTCLTVARWILRITNKTSKIIDSNARP